MRTEHNVEIEGADNGFIVRVGCKRFVFKDGDVKEFLSDLEILLTEGYKGERILRKKYLPQEENAKGECCSAPAVYQANPAGIAQIERG